MHQRKGQKVDSLWASEKRELEPRPQAPKETLRETRAAPGERPPGTPGEPRPNDPMDKSRDDSDSRCPVDFHGSQTGHPFSVS